MMRLIAWDKIDQRPKAAPYFTMTLDEQRRFKRAETSYELLIAADDALLL
jgi:hypothetical protein